VNGIRSLTVLKNNFLISASDMSIKIWNILFRTLLDSFSIGNGTIGLIQALNSTHIVCTSRNEIYIWDIKEKSIKGILNSHTDTVFDVIKLKNGSYISASADKSIKLWNKNHTLVVTLDTQIAVKCLVELSNNRIASSSEDKKIKIWDLNNLQSVWEITTLEGPAYRIRCLSYIESVNYLASGSFDSQIFIWDIKDFTLKKILQAVGNVYSLGTLNNGDLVSGSDNGYVQIWNRKSLTEIKSFYRDAAAICCFALLPTGNLAVGLANGKIDILNLIY